MEWGFDLVGEQVDGCFIWWIREVQRLYGMRLLMEVQVQQVGAPKNFKGRCLDAK